MIIKSERESISGDTYAIDKCKGLLTELHKSTKLIKSSDGQSVIRKINDLCVLLDELVG